MPPTSKKRTRKQSVKKRYAKAREDAQLEGIIETTPAGAVRPEAVDPKTQTETTDPNLVRRAVECGWAVPAERKPELVDKMVDIVRNGEEKNKVAAFRALGAMDKHQFERDHPEEVAKRNAAAQVNVNVDVNSPTNIFQQLLRTAAEPMPDPLEERIKQDQQEEKENDIAANELDTKAD